MSQEEFDVEKSKAELRASGKNIVTFKGGLARKISREAKRRGVSPNEAILAIITEKLLQLEKAGEL